MNRKNGHKGTKQNCFDPFVPVCVEGELGFVTLIENTPE